MSFFEAAGAVAKISLSLQITNFNQDKLVQIRDSNNVKGIVTEFCNGNKFILFNQLTEVRFDINYLYDF